MLMNLQPAKLRGVESNGMLLAGEDGENVGLVLPGEDAPVGVQLLGLRGAPPISFDDFRKLTIVVDDGGQVFFVEDEAPIPVGREGRVATVDKGIRDGSPVR